MIISSRLVYLAPKSTFSFLVLEYSGIILTFECIFIYFNVAHALDHCETKADNLYISTFFYVWKIWAFAQSFHCVPYTHSLLSYDFIALIHCTIYYLFTFQLMIWTKYVSVNIFCLFETSKSCHNSCINCVNEYTWRNPRLLD